MDIKTIIHTLEQWAPGDYQESYDNSGLLTGDASWDCTGVLISLDCLESVVDEAIERGCNLIVAHHPILFRGLKKIIGKNYVEKVVIKAIKNDIALYAIHTNLDNVHTGVNRKIAELLGLENPKILVPKQGMLMKLVSFAPENVTENVLQSLYAAGAGNIGNYDQCSFRVEGTGTFRPSEEANPFIGEKMQQESAHENRIEVIFEKHKTARILQALRSAHPYEEVAYYLQTIENHHQEVGSGMIGTLPKPIPTKVFLTFLKEKMNVSCIRHTDLCKESIQKVAVCGGAGSFLIPVAKSQRADIYITSDIKYHEFFDAEGKIILADIGHYESEAYTKELIYDFLKEKFTNIALRLSDVYTNPIKYF